MQDEDGSRGGRSKAWAGRGGVRVPVGTTGGGCVWGGVRVGVPTHHLSPKLCTFAPRTEKDTLTTYASLYSKATKRPGHL